MNNFDQIKMEGKMLAKKISALTAGDIMTKRVGKISQDAIIIDAVRDLFVMNIGAMVVCNDKEEVVGKFTERDVLRRVVPESLKIKKVHVEEVMTMHPVTVTSDTSIFEVYHMMSELNFRHVPVVDDNKLVGIISIKDIAKACMKYVEEHKDD